MHKEDVKKKLNKLFSSMDYIVDNYLSKRKITPKEAEVFYGIYQQLGLLWEFLGCLCKHRDGYKKKGDKFLCKVCGKVKGTRESHYLLPAIGEKIIGRMVRPGEDMLKKLSKKEAEIIDDTFKFHGAKLNVSVFNGYVSKLDKTGKEINIAADRIVTLEEDRLMFKISKYIASMKIRGREKQMPIYGGFLWELSKKILKKMPIILSYDRYGRLVEIELLT